MFSSRNPGNTASLFDRPMWRPSGGLVVGNVQMAMWQAVSGLSERGKQTVSRLGVVTSGLFLILAAVVYDSYDWGGFSLASLVGIHVDCMCS